MARVESVVVPVVAFLALCGYLAIYAGGLARGPVRSDGFGYFIYLPAVVVHGDPSLERVAEDCCGGRLHHGIRRWPATGHFVNQYPIGVAVLAAPVFSAMHVLSHWSGLPTDGFSPFYQHAAGLWAIVALAAGLELLRRVLRRTYSPAIVAATLATIALGTNLLHYATWDPLYSHVYSFALICALLFAVPRWYERPDARRSILLGAVAGLIVLVRHPNALFLLLIPLYGLTTPRGIGIRARELAASWRGIAVSAATAVLLVLPQLALYRASTGHWIVSAYGDQWFDFAHPQLFGVLFSVTKGLFFWSPILLVAVAGLFLMRNAAAAWRIGIVATLALHTYLIASWWNWQMGSSYGHRGFTDTLGLFALPLAAVFERVAPHRALRAGVTLVVGAAIVLSLVQMVLVWIGVMPMQDATWEQYRRALLELG